MANPLRQAIAPLYLLLCLLVGGSAQGLWGNTLLQLSGLAIIAWSAAAPGNEPLARPVRQLLWLLMAALGIVALQLVPLPGSLWPSLGGREELAEGYRVLGLAVPARPLSLTPNHAGGTLLTLVPAMAVFCAIVSLKAYRPSWLVFALLAGTFGGIALGTLQVSSADPLSSSWYLYRQSSFGFATGFFANGNHMAILLVICFPFLAALAASARGANAQRYSAALAIAGGAALVLVVGIALNRSLAGYGLAVPALVASALVIIPRMGVLRRAIAISAGVMLAGMVAALAMSPLGERELGTSTSVHSRAVINSTTAEAARDFLPFGSGVGSFRGVYQLYENHDSVTRIRVNHAHNDYLELALELGLPGVVLIVTFLAWWAIAAWRAWRFPDAGPYARAASIASAALLAHSLVEYPLRTAALSAVFAMCLALLVERGVRKAERADLRPTRHLELR